MCEVPLENAANSLAKPASLECYVTTSASRGGLPSTFESIQRIALARRASDPASPLQGYLAHKKPPNPLGTPWDPGHRPTVGSYGDAFSYK